MESVGDPKQALLIENDSEVVSIRAKKIELDEDQEEYYGVVVETVQTMSSKSTRSAN